MSRRPPIIKSVPTGNKPQRIERMYALLEEPEKFEELCESIASGSTLYDISKRWEVPYSRLHLWIFSEAHPERGAAYARAMEARQSYYTEAIISRLMEIGRTELSKCYDAAGNVLPISEMPPEAQSALRSVEQTINATTGARTNKITLGDPIAALNLLGKHHHMFGADVNVSVSGKLTHEVAKAASIADLTDAEIAEIRSGEISKALLARISAVPGTATADKSGG